MIELVVKTLDSKNHSFSVPDNVTVKQFKEHIAEAVNISPDSQRLIYCGRVLQDEKNLSEYDVNGKVVHLVQRAPPVSNGSGVDRGPSTTRSATGTSGARGTPLRTFFGRGGNAGNAMYLGAMAFPAEIMDASGISLQQPRQCLAQSRLAAVRNMLRRASVILNRLENPPQESSDTSPENGNCHPETNVEADTATGGAPIASIEISPGSFIIDNQQINVGGPSVEVQSEPASEQSSVPVNNEPQAASTSDQQQPPQNGNEEEASSTPNPGTPRTQALAELMDQATDINTRVQPFMAQYQQLLREDPVFTNQTAVATNQRLFTSVSEIMHNLAHAYHALSDVMCDFSQQPPRSLRCRPVLIHHSAVVQAGIPLQLTGNLAVGSQLSTNNEEENTRPNESAAGATQSTATEPEEPASEPPFVFVEPQPPSEQTAQSQPASASTAQQPHSPSVSPPRTAHTVIGQVGTGGPGFEIFVDVAPGSITIDSVEATVLTNAPPNTSEPNTWQNPPEFVQNLITALAGQFMGATLQQYRFPDQQNSSNNSGNSQQASTAAGSTQQVSTAASSSQQASTAANSHPAAGIQNSQARGNTATHPTTATQTRSTARPHVHLAPSIHGLRTNSFDPFLPCTSHHIRSSRGGRQRTGQGQANNGANTTPEAPRVIPIPPTSSISISLRADPLINVEPNPSRSGGAHRTPQAAVLPPELQALFQNMRNPHVSSEQIYPQQMAHLMQALQGSQNPATLAQLLQNVPGYSYTPGESIFTDIFMTLAQSLSFLDMVQLGLGNSECLMRARPQLRQLISQRFLNNGPLTTPAITRIIDNVNAELRPYYSIFENARLREEVDLPATINLYNHSMLPNILDTVFAEDQVLFHRTLMKRCAIYVRKLCTLLQYCCLDGVSGLENILRAFVDQMTAGVPGMLQEWTMSHSISNFRTFVSSLNIPTNDIKSFLVYRIGNPASSPQTTTTSPIIPPAGEPMDIQENEEIEIELTPRRNREPPIADVPPTQRINEVIGWQSALPSEWVPIITRDSQRQRRQNPQGPFSDAYLSGMPSKRRKLITSSKPQGNLSQVITESMATALGAAGMSSSPEVDVIAQRAGQDGTLRAAYREQVRTTLRHNLNSNPDYLPDKYPNTAKYLKKP